MSALDLDPGQLRHTATCKGARLARRPAFTRPGWVVVHCLCCHAIAVVPDPEPAQLDLEET